MIGDIVLGRERSTLICVEDSIEQSGIDVINSFVTSLQNRADQVHVVCLDPPSIDFKPSDRLVIHDAYSDTCGWINSSASLTTETDLVTYLTNQTKASSNKNLAVVIVSLSPLLLHRGAVRTCQVLHQLSRAKINGGVILQVVCLVHSDLHDNNSLTLIRHVTSSILKISPSKSPDHFALCSVFHKKLSGKVVKVREHFNITSTNQITDVQELKHTVTMTTKEPEQEPDPTANLTFNLSLTDAEKEARSKLVLPYMQAMDRPVLDSGQQGGGKIFYQPDEADDFDEEDPDDDLDI